MPTDPHSGERKAAAAVGRLLCDSGAGCSGLWQEESLTGTVGVTWERLGGGTRAKELLRYYMYGAQGRRNGAEGEERLGNTKGPARGSLARGVTGIQAEVFPWCLHG